MTDLGLSQEFKIVLTLGNNSYSSSREQFKGEKSLLSQLVKKKVF